MTSAPPPAWTVRLCRGLPGAAETASVAASQGTAVRWCGEDCTCGRGASAETVQLSGISSREIIPQYEDGPDD